MAPVTWKWPSLTLSRRTTSALLAVVLLVFVVRGLRGWQHISSYPHRHLIPKDATAAFADYLTESQAIDLVAFEGHTKSAAKVVGTGHVIGDIQGERVYVRTDPNALFEKSFQWPGLLSLKETTPAITRTFFDPRDGSIRRIQLLAADAQSSGHHFADDIGSNAHYLISDEVFYALADGTAHVLTQDVTILNPSETHKQHAHFHTVSSDADGGEARYLGDWVYEQLVHGPSIMEADEDASSSSASRISQAVTLAPKQRIAAQSWVTLGVASEVIAIQHANPLVARAGSRDTESVGGEGEEANEEEDGRGVAAEQPFSDNSVRSSNGSMRGDGTGTTTSTNSSADVDAIAQGAPAENGARLAHLRHLRSAPSSDAQPISSIAWSHAKVQQLRNARHSSLHDLHRYTASFQGPVRGDCLYRLFLLLQVLPFSDAPIEDASVKRHATPVIGCFHGPPFPFHARDAELQARGYYGAKTSVDGVGVQLRALLATPHAIPDVVDFARTWGSFLRSHGCGGFGLVQPSSAHFSEHRDGSMAVPGVVQMSLVFAGLERTSETLFRLMPAWNLDPEEELALTLNLGDDVEVLLQATQLSTILTLSGRQAKVYVHERGGDVHQLVLNKQLSFASDTLYIALSSSVSPDQFNFGSTINRPIMNHPSTSTSLIVFIFVAIAGFHVMLIRMVYREFCARKN